VGTPFSDALSDLAVWERARQDGYCLVSKDSDFNELLAAKGFPPKVIWIRLGNCTTSQIATLLDDQRDTIVAMLLANQALTLNPSPNRPCGTRRGTSKSVFLPFSQHSVREKGPGDEGKNAAKSIDQQHL
jgi:predicted nuclease of predicted toxin-antitoxin system